ncbi:hypothetical protein B0I37DRAFT_381903 [Chaetomium sp. MPI-CAGE-AT-0009]|nr:hypothetical protein B0I37DRAFT_381903 [Chaetomium sp. MPI-CAGE-AT-0009]
MSGLEVLGAAASLIGVVGGLKTCIDLLDIISSARGAEVEVEDLFVHFQWQRIRFYCWVQETGFSEAIIQHDERRPPQAPDMLAFLPHELRREFILSHIQRSVANMNARLQAAKPTLERYFSRRESTNVTWKERLDCFLDPHIALRVVPAREPEAEQVKFGLWARLRWASRDEKELSQLVDTLRKYNAELAELLPLYRVARFERRIGRVLVTTRQLAAGIAAIGLKGDTTAGGEGDDGVQPYRRVARLLESRHETDVLEAASPGPAGQTSGKMSQTPSSSTIYSPRTPVSQTSLHLRASEFKFKKQEGGGLRTREFASWEASPVIIEWRYYSTKETRTSLAGVDARVHMLAMQLQQLSALDDTGVMACLGHFRDEAHHRYAIVFRYPDDCSAASPVSLGDRLRQDQPLRIRRDLEDRLRIARGLIKTVYQMLSVNWVHKGISSANILLFDESEVNSLSEGRAYLCGFDFARRDADIELSEKLPSVYKNSCPSLDERLYWHPDRNRDHGSPHNADENTRATPRYRREFDVYSLGVVLLEIGLWCPAQRLLKDCRTEDLVVFAEELRKTYVPELRGRMGRVYAEIVTCCLEGLGRFGQDSGHPSGNEVESELDNDEELRRRRFLEDLERKVVCKIENPLGF